MSFPFRDRSRLSDRYRGKTADELLNELKSEIDKDRKMFFETPFPRSGFPFDDNVPRGRQDIRAHLEDLAQRHPEFADQLRCPPWGGEVGPSQGTWSRSRQGSSGDTSAPPQPPAEPEQTDRGRARENNLPQHGLRNTVDLGQKQQEAEQEKSRGQRSMSAPPDNRSSDQPQRYVSRIDINPLNSGEGKPPMAPKQQPASKPAQQGASNVRHIPIFVEGRDEPVISKNLDSVPEKVFSERTIPTQTAFPSDRIPQAPFVERVIPTQSAFPSERVGRPQSPFAERVIPSQTVPPQPSFGFNRPSHFTSQHQFQPQQPSNVPQGKGFPKKQQQQPQQPQQQQPPQQQSAEQPEEQQAKPQQQPPKPKVPEPTDALSQVHAVEKDVEELATKVEAFSGNSRKEKEYIYLDEMLTRNLIKLDVIETEGREDIRQARKAVIRNIQRCINLLESKVPVPGESMEVAEDAQQSEGNESGQAESAVVEAKEDLSAESVPGEVTEQPAVPSETMNIEPAPEQAAQPTEPMAMEGSAEVSSEPAEGAVQPPDDVAKEQPPCVEMAEPTQGEPAGSVVTEEEKPTEADGESAVANESSSDVVMEVESGASEGDVKADSGASANAEHGSGDQTPTKGKKGGKKSGAKSKKAPQPSS